MEAARPVIAPRGEEVARATKPSLADELSRRFKDKGIPLAEAARRAEVPVNSLKSWLHRDRFPRRDLAAVVRVAGLSPDLQKLEDEFEFAWTRGKTTPRVLHQLDKETLNGLSPHAASSEVYDFIRQISRLSQEFERVVRYQFIALTKGDLFVYCSLDVPPLETEPVHLVELGRLVAEGVLRGAHFIYLRPSQDALARIRELGVRPLPALEDIRQGFGQLFDFVTEAVGSRQPNSLRVKDRLALIECDESPFFMPGHKFAIFRHHRREISSSCFGHFRVGPTQKLVELHLPMNQQFTNQFWAFCERTLRNNDMGHALLGPSLTS